MGKVPGTKVGRTIYFEADKAMKALSITLTPDKVKAIKRHDPTDDM